jgi:uncharacterized protein (DUF924 family)
MTFAEVLDFWFGAADSPWRGRARKAWFVKSEDFDREVRDRFAPLCEKAGSGGLDHWRDTPLASLALVVVLDQFPRNIFRGTARAFASDGRALEVATGMVGRGFDRLLRPIECAFVYLPFEHAESIEAQRRSIELFGRLAEAGLSHVEWAKKHYDVVERFGRFPHRNEILGRPSTPEEIEFLKQPGSRF